MQLSGLCLHNARNAKQNWYWQMNFAGVAASLLKQSFVLNAIQLCAKAISSAGNAEQSWKKIRKNELRVMCFELCEYYF